MTEWLHFHFSLSCIGEANGNPLQRSCLENPRDGGAWWVAIYGVAQSRTQLKWLSSSSSFLSLTPYSPATVEEQELRRLMQTPSVQLKMKKLLYFCKNLGRIVLSTNIFYQNLARWISSIIFYLFVSCWKVTGFEGCNFCLNQFINVNSRIICKIVISSMLKQNEFLKNCVE